MVLMDFSNSIIYIIYYNILVVMVLVVMHSRASRLQFWSTEVKVEGGSLGKRSRDMDP